MVVVVVVVVWRCSGGATAWNEEELESMEVTIGVHNVASGLTTNTSENNPI